MRGLLQNGAGDRDPPGLQGPCKNHHLGGAPEFLTPGGGVTSPPRLGSGRLPPNQRCLLVTKFSAL